MSELYVGLMSGTSLDGVDAALVDLTSPPGRLVASHFVPYPDAVRAEALALNVPGPDEVARAASLANRLAELCARATAELLVRAGERREAVAAIGCHGQTVRHRPESGYAIPHLPGTRVATTAVAGIDPDWVESMAFAWLARQAIRGESGSLPEVTGARSSRVLGAIHPA